MKFARTGILAATSALATSGLTALVLSSTGLSATEGGSYSMRLGDVVTAAEPAGGMPLA